VFDTLLESRPRRASRPSRWGVAVALALHVVVVAAFLRPPPPVEAARSIVIDPISFPLAPRSPRPNDVGLRAPVVRCDCELPPIPTPGPFPDILVGREPATPVPGGTVAAPPLDPWNLGAGEPLPFTLVQEPPVLLAAPTPAYPPLLLAAGVQGRVEVQLVVDTLGRTEGGSFRIVHSDHPGFEAPAVESLRGALFRPARVFGRAVRVLVQVPVVFVLRR
jgi:TonB family protein